jgi:serine/threonine-protein kinase
MSPRSITPAPPASLDDLLLLLRRARLLDESQGRRLAAGWPADLPAAEGARRLVDAGLLTAFQAEHVLAGRARRLRLGPYRLLAPLGGRRVYKAEHVLMKRLVTLKVLGRARPRRPQTPDDDSPPARRPGNEMTITAGLSHPNLVSALHAARLRGRLVLVLEYVPGIDLEEFIAQAGPLPVDLARVVLRQAAQALACLHAHRLVHRDVKPANLILGHTGGEPRGSSPRSWLVKLIDLGLACRAGVVPDDLCGTIDYLAPERGMGATADVRADLYSLGCTLYHLLTGQVPFPGGNWTSKLLRHRLECPAPLASLRPDVPAHLVAVVDRLMARDPGDRFADPQALLDSLDRPRPRVPLAQPVPAPRRGRMHGVLVLLGSAIVAGAVLGGLARLSWPALFAATSGDSSPRLAGPPPARVTVAGREEVFAGLEKAIEAAPAEATLILHGRGPHRLRPVAWRGRSLTLRAGGKERPRLERLDAPGSEWEALLSCAGDLVLEGLELSGGSGTDRVVPVVTVSEGSLHLRDCRVEGQTGGPLVALRRGRAVRLERSTIDARAQAVAVEQAPGRGIEVSLTDCRLHVRDRTGAALLVWATEAAPAPAATVQLRRCRIEAGRVLACRALGGTMRVQAEDCRIVFHQALLSLDACPERHAWTRWLEWRPGRNEYLAHGPWVRLDGRPAVWDEANWRRVWAGEPSH